MMKVQKGNDFNVTWVIMEDEFTPLNTEGIYDEVLILACYKIEKELITGVNRTDNSIRIEITPVLAPYRGEYSIEWRYKQSDPAFRGGYRNRAIGANIFSIVDWSYQSDGVRDFTVTTILTK